MAETPLKHRCVQQNFFRFYQTYQWFPLCFYTSILVLFSKVIFSCNLISFCFFWNFWCKLLVLHLKILWTITSVWLWLKNQLISAYSFFHFIRRFGFLVPFMFFIPLPFDSECSDFSAIQLTRKEDKGYENYLSDIHTPFGYIWRNDHSEQDYRFLSYI